MLRFLSSIVSALLISTAASRGEPEQLLWGDESGQQVAAPWKWREMVADAWQLGGANLQMRSLPGNVWGGARDLRNWLFRPVPQRGEISTEVTVSGAPQAEYEQAGLMWYANDANYVKVMQEWLNGKLVVNFVREEDDRPEIVATAPLAGDTVTLRLTLNATEYAAEFRTRGDQPWQRLGACKVLRSGVKQAGVGTMQGVENSGRWVTFSGFRISD